jgi:serine/threonine protein kinase
LGDGANISSEYFEVRGNRPGELTDVPRIPEPFLWHVVESLAIAGLLLERGVVDGNPMRNWETIVHRDLRPANIFFGDPDPERFNRYPTPKIGDWGLAVYAPPSDYEGDISTKYRSEGPYRNVAPEQRPSEMHKAGLKKGCLLSSKTNVWVSVCPKLQVRSKGEND